MSGILALGVCLIAAGVLWMAWTYVGFPLALSVSGRDVEAPHVSPDSELPPIAVVLAMHNEQELVISKIEDLLAQDYPAHLLNIVVVDDGSTDGSGELVQASFGERVQLVPLAHNQGKNVALNEAMQRLPSCKYVATTDVDALLHPSALRHLAQCLETNPDVGLAGGTISYRGAQSSAREQAYFAYESLVRHLESRHLSSVCIAGQLEMHRQELWQPLPRGVATDMGTALLVLSQGYGCVQVSGAQVWTPAGSRVSTELQRKRRTIRRGLRTIAWKWRELGVKQRIFLLNHKLCRYVLPVAEALTVGGLLLISFAPGWVGHSAIAAAAVPALGIATGAVLARQDSVGPRWARLLVGAYYFHAVHLIALREMCRWLAGDVSEAQWNATRDGGLTAGRGVEPALK